MQAIGILEFGRKNRLTPYLVFGPIIGGLSWVSVRWSTQGSLHLLAMFLLGLFSWTLVEYLLHRFAFHARGSLEYSISAQTHRSHHHDPQSKNHLVAPPSMAVAYFALYLGIAGVLVREISGASALAAGLAVGYLIYEQIHYSTHHRIPKNRLMRILKKQHMQHHFHDGSSRFGVSSPLWDLIFGTAR